VGKFLALERIREALGRLAANEEGADGWRAMDSARDMYRRFFMAAMSTRGENIQGVRTVSDSLVGALEDYRTRKAALTESALMQNFEIRNNMRTWLFILLLNMIGVIAVGSVTLFLRIIHPAIALSDAAARFVQGDFASRVKAVHDDEMGNLIRTFNIMAEDISRREKSRLDFTASVVHDIKNPLVIIGAAVRMMRKLSRRLREVTAMLEEALGRRLPEPEAHPAAPAPPARRRPAADVCRLATADGQTEFPLNREGDTLIGRADPVTGITPDVDLTPLDTQRSTSRRHAKVYQLGGSFYVMEEIGVMNGTFVNDRRLTTGTPVALQNGDVLKFGLVALTFHDPRAAAPRA
jgi:hypothetical protein